MGPQVLEGVLDMPYPYVRILHKGKDTMSSSTLTSKGQTTIPKDIRDHLKLRSGHRIDYVVEDDGRVVLKPATYDIRDLAGILRCPGQKPLSVEDMNRVIRQRHGAEP